jgi:hypothetical protein
VATDKWVVETNPKWRLGDSDRVMYDWLAYITLLNWVIVRQSSSH